MGMAGLVSAGTQISGVQGSRLGAVSSVFAFVCVSLVVFWLCRGSRGRRVEGGVVALKVQSSRLRIRFEASFCAKLEVLAGSWPFWYGV